MHDRPHTDAAKAKIAAAKHGKPAPWKHRPSRVEDGVTLYRCGRCGEFLPTERFHSTRRNSLGIRAECRTCHSAVSVASRCPENARRLRRASEATRRARKANAEGRVTADDRQRLAAILGASCLCCGSAEQPTEDHVRPLSKGGRHHPTNLQPLCRPCNERKQAREVDYRTPAQVAAVMAAWAVTFSVARVNVEDHLAAAAGASPSSPSNPEVQE